MMLENHKTPLNHVKAIKYTCDTLVSFQFISFRFVSFLVELKQKFRIKSHTLKLPLIEGSYIKNVQKKKKKKKKEHKTEYKVQALAIL